MVSGLLILMAARTSAFPHRMNCTGPSWSVGLFVTSKMGPDNLYLSDGSSECVLSGSLFDTNQYAAGKNYSIAISGASSNMGYKLQVSAGMLVDGGSHIQDSKCRSTYPRAASTSYTWSAPATAGFGNVTLHILCGVYSAIYARHVNLTEGTAAPTASPVTIAPTITRNPTMGPTSTAPSLGPTTCVPTTHAPSISSARPCVTNGALGDHSAYLCSWTTKLGVTLSWTLNATHMRMRANTSATGWVGVGFSPGAQMVGSVAVMGWCGSNSSSVAEYKLEWKASDGIQTTGTPLSGATCVESGGETSIAFTRPLVASSHTVDPNHDLTLVYARSNDDFLSRHGVSERGIATVNLITGESSDVDEVSYVILHSVLMWCGICLCIPLGSIVARYGKEISDFDPDSVCFCFGIPLWFMLHVLAQTSGTALVLAGFLVSFRVDNDGERYEDPHGRLGMSLFLMVAFQYAMGAMCPRRKGTRGLVSMRTVWNFWHHLIAYAIILAGASQVFLGLEADPNSNPLWAKLHTGWIVFLSCVWAACEWFLKRRGPARPFEGDKETKSKVDKTIETIRSYNERAAGTNRIGIALTPRADGTHASPPSPGSPGSPDSPVSLRDMF